MVVDDLGQFSEIRLIGLHCCQCTTIFCPTVQPLLANAARYLLDLPNVGVMLFDVLTQTMSSIEQVCPTTEPKDSPPLWGLVFLVFVGMLVKMLGKAALVYGRLKLVKKRLVLAHATTPFVVCCCQHCRVRVRTR